MLLISFLVTAHAQATQSYQERFNIAWTLVNERYWDETVIETIWQEVKVRYEPEALSASSDLAFYDVLQRMYDELDDEHSVFVPPQKVEDIRQQYGDLPCFGIFGHVVPAQLPSLYRAQDTQDSPAITTSVQNFVGRLRTFLQERNTPTYTSLGNIRYTRLESNHGHIILPDLATAFTPVHVREAVQQLEREGVSGFVLDLRGNPGGRLVEMMQVAGVFTSGFLWRTITRWTIPIPYPAVGQIETDLPLVVLIDNDVNSAAEGLAGALQNTGRATLIGQTTAGNVEAVLPFCFRDGSQAWIATGVLAPVQGSTWEGRGVVPDIEAPAQETLDTAIAYLENQEG